MAARFPQSASSVAYQIKAAYSSKILAIYWAASADSVHRLYPGDTATTILTRATSGAGFNATDGRITGTVSGASGVYFSDSKSGGLGTTEAGPLTYIASYWGDLFNGGGNAWLFGNATPMDTFNDHTSAKVSSYSIDLVRKGAVTLTLSSAIGIADDVAAWVVLGYRYDPADGTAQHRLWNNGTELTAQRANGASGISGTIGATATPFIFGGTVAGTGNTKLEGECWIVGKDISDADMAAITANPSIVIELASGGGGGSKTGITYFYQRGNRNV